MLATLSPLGVRGFVPKKIPWDYNGFPCEKKNQDHMENQNFRDKKRRVLIQKYEEKRRLYQYLACDMHLPKEVRFEYALCLNKLPRNSSLVRRQNRCIETGRSKAVYKQFRLSRIRFRELARQGLLPGVFKASW